MASPPHLAPAILISSTLILGDTLPTRHQDKAPATQTWVWEGGQVPIGQA